MDCTPSASSAGVNVQILGTEISAVSDSSGSFVLSGIPAGYWSISFSKPGFSEIIQSPVEFVGGGSLHLSSNVEIERINNWKTTLSFPSKSKYPGYSSLFSIDFPSGGPMVADSTGKNLFPIENVDIFFFVGSNPNVNYQDTSTYISWNYFNVSSNAGSGGAYNFYSPRAHDGDTLYMIAYPTMPCGGIYQYSYYVGDSLKTTFTGFGPASNIVKIVLP